MATFQFTKSEYVAAAMGLARRRMLLSRLLFFIAFSLFAAANFDGYYNWIAWLASCAALTLLVHFSLRFWLRRRLGKAFSDQASLHENIEARIDAAGIHYTHETGSYEFTWDRVRKWMENRDFIYLYESDLFARILPKRALSDAEATSLRSGLKETKKLS